MIKNTKFSKLLTEEVTISSKFHQSINIEHLDSSQLPIADWPVTWKNVMYKQYPRFNRVMLTPNPSLIKGNLLHSLCKRVSSREYSNIPISLNELSTLLVFSLGIRPDTAQNLKTAQRYYPSAGARFPIETYILINRNGIEDLPSYSYHLNVKRNCLEKMFPLTEELFPNIVDQEWILNSNILICFSAVFERSQIKYGGRSYRYCLIEAGHCAQNLYLLSSELNLKCSAVGKYSDIKINKYLELDESSESIIYMMAIGK